MKTQNQTMSPEGQSRRLALKIAGAGLAAGIVSSAGIAGAIQQDMMKSNSSKDIGILVHFADTDYNETVIKNANIFNGLNADLLMRSYAYVDYKKTVGRVFHRIHPHDELSNVLGNSRVVISTCSLTLLEAQKAGAFPVYLNDGKTPEFTIDMLKAQQINVVDLTDRKGLVSAIRNPLGEKESFVTA